MSERDMQPELCAAGPTLGEIAYHGFFAARDSSDVVIAEGWESLLQHRREWWESCARAVERAVLAGHHG